jgi:hypothetical protein
MPGQFIMLLVVALIGVGGFWWLKNADKKRAAEKQTAAKPGEKTEFEKTAQEFTNAREIKDDCLFTLDGKMFCYIEIFGVSLELLSDDDLRKLRMRLGTALSKVQRDYKYFAVSRKADISLAINDYKAIIENTLQHGKIKLLREDMRNLIRLSASGESLERRHFFAIWNSVSSENVKDLKRRAAEFAEVFSSAGITAHVLDKNEVVRFITLLNAPEYAHVDPDFFADEEI